MFRSFPLDSPTTNVLSVAFCSGVNIPIRSGKQVLADAVPGAYDAATWQPACQMPGLTGERTRDLFAFQPQPRASRSGGDAMKKIPFPLVSLCLLLAMADGARTQS